MNRALTGLLLCLLPIAACRADDDVDAALALQKKAPATEGRVDAKLEQERKDLNAATRRRHDEEERARAERARSAPDMGGPVSRGAWRATPFKKFGHWNEGGYEIHCLEGRKKGESEKVYWNKQGRLFTPGFIGNHAVTGIEDAAQQFCGN
jgi:hypothetical protein